MPLTLPNLYCTPNDIMDDMGVEATQLRLDDRRQSTGQTIQVRNPAAQSAVSLDITALVYPLLAGTNLQFDGGGNSARGEAILTATARVGDQTLAVSPLANPISALATAIDNGTTLYMASLALKACRYATSQVKLYCCGRYDDSDLYANATENGSVNRWAVALAKKWMCRRLVRSVPQSVADAVEETMDELKRVQTMQLFIEDIATRTASWPSITNYTVDVRYDIARVRVEPMLSDPIAPQYPQFVDYNSIYYLEW